MRTLTAAQAAVIMARRGWGGWARVKVQDGGGTYRDLTSLLGQHFLQGVTLDAQTDAPVDACTVYVRREVNGYKLAPLVTDSPVNLLTGSYSPLLKEGRTFVVETAVLPDGSTPVNADYIEVFRGRIDRVDAGGDELTFEGRDLSGKLMDTFIEVERSHSTQSLESHITKILTDNSMVAEFPLYTVGMPAVNFSAYVQDTKPVYEAIQALARQIGWEVRWKWDNGTSAFRLTLWTPDRSASSPVTTLSATEYTALSTVLSTMEDVRNVVEVVYSDTADLDTTGKPKRKTHTETNSSSITAYGRRWMRIVEAASSNINTSTEAERMAEAALSDLATPTLEIAAELDYRPDIELGDYIRFAGNGWHFTADQDCAVVKVTHDFRGRNSRTRVLARGKPSTSRRSWLEMDVRPGVAPAPPFTGPGAPTNVAVTAVVNGVRVTWAPPSTGPSSPAAASYEVHISTSSGFTPGSSTYRGATDSFEFVDPSLLPGTTYYAKIVPRDAKGNVGTTSSQASIDSRYVEPRFMQPRGGFHSAVPNADFEANNVANSPPDTWTMAAFADGNPITGVWGTDVVLSTDTYSGGNSVKLVGGGSGSPLVVKGVLASAFIVIRHSEHYLLDVFYKGNGTAGTSSVNLTLYDSSFSVLVAGITFNLDNSKTSWTRALKAAPALHASARYARVKLNAAVTSGSDVLIDSVVMERIDSGSVFARYINGSAQTITDATSTIVNFGVTTGDDDYSAVTTGASWKYTAPISGVYLFEASIALQSVPAGTDVLSRFYKNGTEVARGPRFTAAAGYAGLHAAATIRMAPGDYVDYRIYQASGGSLTTEADTGFITAKRLGP